MVVGSLPEVTEGGRRPPEVTGGRLPTTILILLRFQDLGEKKKRRKEGKLQTANQSHFFPKIDSSTTYQKMSVIAITVSEI